MDDSNVQIEEVYKRVRLYIRKQTVRYVQEIQEKINTGQFCSMDEIWQTVPMVYFLIK